MIDARFHNHGTLIGIVPITTAAQDWIDEHVDAEASLAARSAARQRASGGVADTITRLVF